MLQSVELPPLEQQDVAAAAPLSKNSQKKLLKIERTKANRIHKKEENRALKASNTEPKELDPDPDRLSKRERIQCERERLQQSLHSPVNIAIDCSYESLMSDKEVNKTRRQIQQCYGRLRKFEHPFHFHLASFNIDSRLYQHCQTKVDGFDSLYITKSDASFVDMFDDIVFMSPDSDNVLQSVEDGKTYVVGGLVDTNIRRHTTASRCRELGVVTARLPIQEHFEGTNHKDQVLTIDQVFHILLSVYHGVSWEEALLKVLPRRKIGTVVNNVTSSASAS